MAAIGDPSIRTVWIVAYNPPMLIKNYNGEKNWFIIVSCVGLHLKLALIFLVEKEERREMRPSLFVYDDLVNWSVSF